MTTPASARYAVALAALAFLLVGGPANAAPVISCTDSASDQTTVQTAINGGGIVTLKGVCLGNWTITSSVALSGAGGTVLDGNATGSVLTVTNGATAAIGNLTIRNGAAVDGGGIFADVDTTVIVKNTTITGNAADDAGGGVYAQGFALVTISGGAITHNESLNAGGGIAVFGASLSATDANVSANLALTGGGIAGQFSNVSLLRTRVTGNTATDFAGGIASFASGSDLEFVSRPTAAAEKGLPFTRLPFRAASSVVRAAGVRASALPLGFTIDSSSIDHNTALGQGGGGIVNVSPGASTLLTIKNSSISFNIVPGPQGVIGAGGIANVGGSPEDTATLDLTGSHLFGNTAPNGTGGGIYNVSEGGITILTLSSTAVSSSRGLLDPNRASFGGGIYQDATFGPAGLTLGRAAGVIHNFAGVDGGGIYNVCGGTITMKPGAAVKLNTPNNIVQAGCAT